MIIMSYDLCIFDLDGTLTDPELGITRSYLHALSAFGIHEEHENLVKLIGPPLRENFRNLYGFSDSDTEKAVKIFREYFVDIGLYENVVYPGIPELLQRLADDGKTLAVATNKVKVYSDSILAHFGLDKYFSCVSGDKLDGSLTVHGKGEIIRIVLDELNPQRKCPTVMIGDRKHDMHGAIENGIDCIGALWGFGSRAELEESGAEVIVQTVEELGQLLLSDY